MARRREYRKRRSKWAEAVMRKYFPEFETWDEQVPLYDFRGWDIKTVESVGPLLFTRAMPRADLIAIRGDTLLIIEFSKRMDLVDITKLDAYIDHVKHDYLRPGWREKRIIPVFVTPGYDARIEYACRLRRYRYIVEPEPA